MKQVLKCVTKNYFTFSKRASRKEYWLFFLASLASSVFTLFMFALDAAYFDSLFSIRLGALRLVALLFLLIPSVAVGVRRLHDTNRSAWYLLLALIPLIGSIWVIVLMCKRGDKGSNSYGNDPLESSTDQVTMA